VDRELEKLKKAAQKTKGKSELAEAIDFLKRLKSEDPCTEALTFAIPNGGFRSGAGARNLSLSGVKAGVPDYFVAVPKSVQLGSMVVWRHGLFLELKRATNAQNKKGGSVSKQQLEWGEALSVKGYAFAVAWGADEALQVVRDYLKGRW